MRAIRYNLSQRKKINPAAFALRISLPVLLTIGLAVLTALNLSHLRRASPAPAVKIKTIERRLLDLTNQSQEYQNFIAQQKKVWQARIALANGLIDQKTFSFCARLNFLEAALPEGIQVNALTLINGAADRIALNLSAASFARLIELYKKLSPFQLIIGSEIEKGGIYQVNLQISYQK